MRSIRRSADVLLPFGVHPPCSETSNPLNSYTQSQPSKPKGLRLGEARAGLSGKADPAPVWEFQKMRGTLFWGPYSKDPTILGYSIGVPYFRKLPYL